MLKGFKKRILVTEGDLQKLWFEVEQVRKSETKARFKSSFKSILKDAQLVELSVVKKGGNNE